jgi:predicted ATP-dependent Lon-type protease
MVLNNLLNSKGYFIHDDNREEVYLEILETGDSGLIDTLERYLNMKDEIHRVSQLDSKFTEITSQIMEDSGGADDVVKMADEFIEEHYKNNT